MTEERLLPVRFSTSSIREFLRIKIRILRHPDERRFRSGRRADAPIGFLVDVEPYDTLDERETVAQGGDDLVDPPALVSASFGGRHLSNDDRFFLCCQQRVDVFEHLLEGLP